MTNLNEILADVQTGFDQISLLIETLGNMPNIAFVLIGFALGIYWLMRQARWSEPQ